MDRLLTVLILSFCLGSCYTKKLSDFEPVLCDTTQVTYNNNIKSIIAANCVQCHTPNGIGPFSLEQYDDVKTHAADIIRAIRHESGLTPMPYQKDKLSGCDIAKVQRWINLNYPN